MEGKRVITLELTPEQEKILKHVVGLEVIYTNPMESVFSLEKIIILNMLYKSLTEEDAYKCDESSISMAAKYHIDEMRKSRDADEEVIKRLTKLLK